MLCYWFSDVFTNTGDWKLSSLLDIMLPAVGGTWSTWHQGYWWYVRLIETRVKSLSELWLQSQDSEFKVETRMLVTILNLIIESVCCATTSCDGCRINWLLTLVSDLCVIKTLSPASVCDIHLMLCYQLLLLTAANKQLNWNAVWHRCLTSEVN